MAQINIKPNRIKFIKALKDSQKRIADAEKDYARDYKQWEKDVEAWARTADLSPDNVKSIRFEDHYSGQYRTVVTLKKYPTGKPKKPAEPRFRNYAAEMAVRDIGDVLALLELTDEDTVSASIANRVAQYIQG